MSYQDLRKGRFSEPGRVYFITTVTKDRIPIFKDLYCARAVINNMKSLHEEGWVNSLSFVIMPDYIHWLFQLKQIRELSVVIKNLKARSCRQINKQLNTTGVIWQKAFYDRAVRENEDLQQIARYIAANPLRAGIVEKLEDYTHWDAIWM